MKSNPEELHQIAAYLRGNLNEEEVKHVQKRISEDSIFAARVAEIRLIRDGTILSKKKALLKELKALEELERKKK